MAWNIKCSNSNCEHHTKAVNIVELLSHKHRDDMGWFVCACGKKAYIEKHFELQESGQVWNPYLRGAITLGSENDSYQPFVFLVSYEPLGEITDVWFSYYKDLREEGGSLKMGYGPGGPPVLNRHSVLALLMQLIKINYLTPGDVSKAIAESANN